MGKIFCVEFQKFPLKFHTKYLTHTLKGMFAEKWRCKLLDLRAICMRFWKAFQVWYLGHEAHSYWVIMEIFSIGSWALVCRELMRLYWVSWAWIMSNLMSIISPEPTQNMRCQKSVPGWICYWCGIYLIMRLGGACILVFRQELLHWFKHFLLSHRPLGVLNEILVK